MSYYKDYREYLEALEKNGELVRVKRPINKDTQLHPLVRLQFRGLPDDKRKVFLFENVIDSNGKRYGVPVVVPSLAASSRTYAIGMMCAIEEIADKMAYAQVHPIEPRLVDSGPAQDEVHAGDRLLEHGGLGEFPIPVTTPGYDSAPYITAPYCVSKDPDTGVPNVGMYRAMVKSPSRTGMMWETADRGMFIDWNKCRERGIPQQAAIVIGGAPNIGYVSVLRVPYGQSELAVAGGIAGEPVELVKCRTVDLEVPATAEIVIEGEVSTRELEPEAPFGEGLGFVGAVQMSAFMDVTCITHRKNPMWLATMSQYPPSESSKLREYLNEATVYKHLVVDLKMSHVLGVAFFNNVGSSRLMVIKLKKSPPAEVWRAIQAAANRFPVTKIVIGVDEDVNIHDLEAVILAVCMRSQPHRDYRIEKIKAPSAIDLSVMPVEEAVKKRDLRLADRPEASRILIDATIKWPFTPVALPRKEFMDEALRIWKEEGLPELELKEPWWGVNLGFWTPENEELARAAARGEHYKAGELYSKRRHAV